MLQFLFRKKEYVRFYTIERAILTGLFLLVLWFIALMTFMENGKNHAINLVFIASLIVLVIIFVRSISKLKSQGYIVAILSTLIAIVSYFQLHSFFPHAEIVFTLSVIAVCARYNPRHGYFAAILTILSNSLLSFFYEHEVWQIETFSFGGFILFAALIVNTITQQRESALKTKTEIYSELNQTYSETIQALVAALDARDQETSGHSERVIAIALTIGHEMHLDEKQIQQLHWGALLHDVGKIGVPDYILRKPGPLTEEEWKVMRKHPQTGYEILQNIPFLQPASVIVLHHHERFDGTGYPLGLQGDAIPISARIFAVADAYDAMTSDRPYRKARLHDDAISEIHNAIKTQFDPLIVAAFDRATKREWQLNPRSQPSRKA